MDFSNYINKLPSELDCIGKSEEYQLTMLYAFYAYFGGEELNIDDLKESTFYSRQFDFNIDGVYVNSSLEEDTVECLHTYYIGNNTYSLMKASKYVQDIFSLIEDCLKRQKFEYCNDALLLLIDKLKETENKHIIIKIITDYVADEQEAYNTRLKFNDLSFKVGQNEVTAEIVFGDEIQAEVEANISPFDYVQDGFLVVDDSKNILKFSDNSFVCNISGKSLKDLWKKEGKKGLLEMNLRYHVKNDNVDGKIEKSIQNSPEDFWYLNNGIIIVCDDFSLKEDNKLRLRNFSIVNGGQTSKKIGETPFDEDFYLTCKVIKNLSYDLNEKNSFIAKVAEASNTQKPIKPKDIIANRVEQRNLKINLQKLDIFIEIKRGEKPPKGKEDWQKTKNNELAQDLYSFVFMNPGPARNSVSTILQSEDKYNTIFKNHSYEPDFLKSILYLEKAYKKYKKQINKKEDVDGTIKGLVSNGMFYCLSIIGYILKIIYNPEFRNSMIKYQNSNDIDIFRNELAFNHAFIDFGYPYKMFAKDITSLFNAIFEYYIKAEYDTQKETNPSLSYSNFTKNNPGFKNILSRINLMLFNVKDESILNLVRNYFVMIDDNQIAKNIDDYVDYCKARKDVKKQKEYEKRVFGDDDYKLIEKLKTFRHEYAIEKGLTESYIMTDKQIESLVRNKPKEKSLLYKFVKRQTVYYIGDKIIELLLNNN